MFGIGNDPFDQFGGQQDQGLDAGELLAGRIMAAEYNLAVQRGDTRQATQALGLMLGQFLANRFGGGR
jgi:hypothetical protein